MIMDGVKEYCEEMNVELIQTTGLFDGEGRGRWVIMAKNEGGYNSTEVDVLQMIDWLRKNRPDLWLGI